MLKGKRDVLAMLLGTLLIGASGYLFLAVIGHGRFDPTTTAALSATYLLAAVFGPGAFIALEQETSRVISDLLARAAAPRPAARRLLIVCVVLAMLTLLTLAVVTPVLLTRVLNGDVGLVLALVGSVVGSAAVYYVRGITGGQRRFGRYAATVVTDGAARIVGLSVLALSGNADPIAYAVALCAGPAIGWLVTSFGSGPPAPGRPITPPGYALLGRDVSWLLVSSVLSLAMANLAPVVVTGMLVDGPAIAAGFATAVVLTRIPLLLMGPIQALILPRMTAAAAGGKLRELRQDVGRGLMIISALGAVAVAIIAILGQRLITLLFGTQAATIGGTELVLLTISAVLFMAVQLLQPALVSLRRHGALMVAWIVGALVFVGSFLVPIEPIAQGILAQLAGPTVTLLLQLITLQVAVQHAIAPDATLLKVEAD